MKKTLCVLLSLILALGVVGAAGTTAFADGTAKTYLIRESDLNTDPDTPHDGVLAARTKDEEGNVTPGTILQPGDSVLLYNVGREARSLAITYAPYAAEDKEAVTQYLTLPSGFINFKDQVESDTKMLYTLKALNGESTQNAFEDNDLEKTGGPIDFTMQYHVFKGWEVTFLETTAKLQAKITVSAVWEEDPDNPIPSDEPEPKTPLEEFIDKVKSYLIVGINVIILLLEGVVEYLETGEISILKGLFGGGEEEPPAVEALFRR